MSGASEIGKALLLGPVGMLAANAMKPGKATAAETPTPEAAKPLPIEDDATRRKARLDAMAKLSQSSGRESTMLTRGKLGKDGEEPMTRSSILNMG